MGVAVHSSCIDSLNLLDDERLITGFGTRELSSVSYWKSRLRKNVLSMLSNPFSGIFRFIIISTVEPLNADTFGTSKKCPDYIGVGRGESGAAMASPLFELNF